MAVPLEGKFMAQLDMLSDQVIKVIRARGGATRQKTAKIMDTLDKVNLYHILRDVVTKRAVKIYLNPS